MTSQAARAHSRAEVFIIDCLHSSAQPQGVGEFCDRSDIEGSDDNLFAVNMAVLLNRRASQIVELALEKLLPPSRSPRKSVRSAARVLLETALTRSALDKRRRTPGPDRLDEVSATKAYTALYNVYAAEKRWKEAEGVALAALKCIEFLSSRNTCCSEDDTQLVADLETAYACTILEQRDCRTPLQRAELVIPHLERSYMLRNLDKYQHGWARTVRMLAESYADAGLLPEAFVMYRNLLRYTPERCALEMLSQLGTSGHSRKETWRERGRMRGEEEERSQLLIFRQRLFRNALKYRMAMLILQRHSTAPGKSGTDESELCMRNEPSRTHVGEGEETVKRLPAAQSVSGDCDMSIDNALHLLQASCETYSEDTLPLWWASVKAVQGILLLLSGRTEKDIALLERSESVLSTAIDANPRAWRDSPYEGSEVYFALQRARRELAAMKVPVPE